MHRTAQHCKPAPKNQTSPAQHRCTGLVAFQTDNSLLVAGEGELCGFAHAAGGPALGDGLAAGEEVHAVGAVHAVVAKRGALPAAEAVVGDRHRQRHVDADHADLDVVAEVARRFAVAGEDAGAVAVFVGVDQVHRFCHRADAHHAQHRAENFFLVGCHARLDVVEQRAADEIAVLVAGHGQRAAVDRDGGALLFGAVDIADDLVAVLRGDQRAHVVAVVGAGPDFHRGHPLLEVGDQLIGDRVADRDRDRDRHAAFAAGAERGAHQCADRIVDVGVGHDDRMVLGAAQRLDALAVGAAGGVDVFGNRGRADEADGLDARVGQQRVDRFLVAVDDVQHAVGQPGLLRQLRDQQHAAGVALGRFQHEGVAAGNRRIDIHSGTIAGKLNGVMPAVTPSAWNSLQESIAGPTFLLCSPLSRSGTPHTYSTFSMPRCSSPVASSSTLPCSAVSSAQIASAFSSSNCLSLLMTCARLSGGVLRQAGYAACALGDGLLDRRFRASATCFLLGRWRG